MTLLSSSPFAQHALIAGTLIAVISGLIGPVRRHPRLAFAVHGTAELAFTGAAAGLVVAGDPVAGALVGSLVVVAAAIGLLGVRERERDSAIGVILAFGLGARRLPAQPLPRLRHRGHEHPVRPDLRHQQRPARRCCSRVAVGVLVAMAVLYRPLLFASVDPERRRGPRGAHPAGRGAVPVRARGHRHRGRADRRHAARAQPRHHPGRRRAAADRPTRAGHRAVASPSPSSPPTAGCSPASRSARSRPASSSPRSASRSTSPPAP